MDTIAITVDCSADDFEKVAAFWAAALGYERVLPGYLIDPAGERPRLAAELDVLFLAVDAAQSREIMAGPGSSVPLVVDNSSAFRLADGVPLVVPEAKVVKNRWHVDLYVENLEALEPRVRQLVDLGAVELYHLDEVTQGFTNVFTAMRDPAGNEFCVCAPHIPVDQTAS